MDSAIARESDEGIEEEFVVAVRPGSAKKRSPRGGNPRVVAVTKLDREIRVVPGPPPPLRVAELDSPMYTESAPELESFVVGAPIDVRPSLVEDLSEDFSRAVDPLEMVEVTIDPEVPEDLMMGTTGRPPVGRTQGTPPTSLVEVGLNVPTTSKRKRGRLPGSGSGSNASASSSEKHAISKIK